MVNKEKIENDLKRFSKRFFDDDSCLRFLEEYKWKGGFVCPQCGNLNACSGKNKHSRRCTRCKKEISPTAHTLFHRCKIPLKKAFEIVYLSCQYPDISTYDMNSLLGIRRMTCYHFQRKAKECFSDQNDTQLIQQIIASVQSMHE